MGHQQLNGHARGVPVDEMIPFFPEGWLNLDQDLYNHCIGRMREYCTRGEELYWNWTMTVNNLLLVQQEMRNQIRFNAVPCHIPLLRHLRKNLDIQLRIMQIEIARGKEAAHDFASLQDI